jgi:hypothetical protein
VEEKSILLLIEDGEVTQAKWDPDEMKAPAIISTSLEHDELRTSPLARKQRTFG